MTRISLNNLLLFCGSSITFATSLLAAFVPGLAYATVYSYFMDKPNPYGLPYVQYQSIDFISHLYTGRFLLSAVGGLIGLLALLGKNKKTYLGVVAIATASLGLMLPAANDMRITIPEARLFDIPWSGALAIAVGICLMFAGLTVKKDHVPKASFLSLPLLMASYSIPPILVLFNYLPWIVFGTAPLDPVNALVWLIPFVSLLLMIGGALSSKWQEIVAPTHNCSRRAMPESNPHPSMRHLKEAQQT